MPIIPLLVKYLLPTVATELIKRIFKKKEKSKDDCRDANNE